MTATKQQPIAGYRISDPSDPTIKPWLSDTPDDNGYTSEPLYAGAAPAAVACPADALAKLRHLYLNMSSGSVRDKSSAKRIAEGLLAPAIAALEAAPALEAPAAPESEPWCPDACPITGRPFFMWIDHWQTGKPVPTYGGPYDSYTIPEKDDEDVFECERYDHDAGEWMTEGMGWYSTGMKLVDDQSFIVHPSNPRYNEIEAFAAAAPQAPAAPTEPGRLDDGMQIRCRKCGEWATIAYNSARIVTHNKHTGKPRDERDIASDPEGRLIVAPGPLPAATVAEPAAPAGDALQELDPGLSREVYRACEDLPEGWSIRIDLENGYGGVKLIDPDGEENELPVDGWLSNAMRESIAAAQAAAKGSQS